MKLLIECIREAGIDETCNETVHCNPEPLIERERNSAALYCVWCGWRYDLTPLEFMAAMEIRKLPILNRPGPKGTRDETAKRDIRISKLYRRGMHVDIISNIEGISVEAIYKALKRGGCPTKRIYKKGNPAHV